LVTGGTYGHRLLFNTLAESDLHNIVLQTGPVDPTPYIKKHPEWKVFTVTERFHELLAGAELVVTQFGVTVLEAVVNKKPVVLVQNLEWTRGATPKDAAYLAKKINGVLVSKIKLEILLDAIDEAKKKKVPTLPNGAENLARIIIRLLRRSKTTRLHGNAR
jgi:UDP-N-acetylglucosamine:LPS N-acetylglucosamine transferase